MSSVRGASVCARGWMTNVSANRAASGARIGVPPERDDGPWSHSRQDDPGERRQLIHGEGRLVAAAAAREVGDQRERRLALADIEGVLELAVRAVEGLVAEARDRGMKQLRLDLDPAHHFRRLRFRAREALRVEAVEPEHDRAAL